MLMWVIVPRLLREGNGGPLVVAANFSALESQPEPHDYCGLEQRPEPLIVARNIARNICVSMV
jgi:hypothetical protein